MVTFLDGSATLSWLPVGKLFKIPEPEKPPPPDPDSLIRGPRNDDQVLAFVAQANGEPLSLVQMFEPIPDGDPAMHPRICFRCLQHLALSAHVDQVRSPRAAA